MPINSIRESDDVADGRNQTYAEELAKQYAKAWDEAESHSDLRKFNDVSKKIIKLGRILLEADNTLRRNEMKCPDVEAIWWRNRPNGFGKR